MKILRTNSKHKDFVSLVTKLDAYLKITDGEDHAFYNQFNSIDVLDHVVVLYHNNIATACGAFKHFDTNSVEIKRMFTLPEFRNLGLAQQVILQLESWAKELGYDHTVLETGKRQVEAVHFYEKNNYSRIKNYGQYKGMANSICFKKQLNQVIEKI